MLLQRQSAEANLAATKYAHFKVLREELVAGLAHHAVEHPCITGAKACRDGVLPVVRAVPAAVQASVLAWHGYVRGRAVLIQVSEILLTARSHRLVGGTRRGARFLGRG